MFNNSKTYTDKTRYVYWFVEYNYKVMYASELLIFIFYRRTNKVIENAVVRVIKRRLTNSFTYTGIYVQYIYNTLQCHIQSYVFLIARLNNSIDH
jgi:hypothetical protein